MNASPYGVQRRQMQSNYDFNLSSVLSAHHSSHHHEHSAH
jgi:hypothetical protein